MDDSKQIMRSRLIKRIQDEFCKKKLLGDIRINDEEFRILVEIFKEKYRRMINSYDRIVNDPVFCIALIQIGIRYYNGRFWPHVKHVLDNPRFAT